MTVEQLYDFSALLFSTASCRSTGYRLDRFADGFSRKLMAGKRESIYLFVVVVYIFNLH